MLWVLVCVKSIEERQREDDTYVLWDDDECDPLALLMVDRKTETLEDSYTPKRVSDFYTIVNDIWTINEAWKGLRGFCVQTWHLSYIWNMCSTMSMFVRVCVLLHDYDCESLQKRFGFDRKKAKLTSCIWLSILASLYYYYMLYRCLVQYLFRCKPPHYCYSNS